jgi:hypothetical protein
LRIQERGAPKVNGCFAGLLLLLLEMESEST